MLLKNSGWQLSCKKGKTNAGALVSQALYNGPRLIQIVFVRISFWGHPHCTQ